MPPDKCYKPRGRTQCVNASRASNSRKERTNQSVLNLIAAVERELLLAVVGDSRNSLAEKNFQRIDAYFAADEPEIRKVRTLSKRA
jgi:hypothetical protein